MDILDILNNPWFRLADLIFWFCVVFAFFRLCWRVKKILTTMERQEQAQYEYAKAIAKGIEKIYKGME